MGASCSHEEDALVPYQGRERLSRSLEDWRQRRFQNNPEFCSFEQLARPLNVLREGIVARKDNEPVLLLGPVIGRVTDSTASFMLEVSEEIDVNISIVQVNGHRGPFDRHVSFMGPTQDFAEQPSLLSLELDRTFFLAKSAVCTAQRLRPGSPHLFQIQSLEPDSPYMVFISNIPEAEMKGPLRFRTMPLRVERLRIVVIGDYAASNFGTMVVEDEMAEDPWIELQKMVAEEREVHVALHVGRSFAAQILDQICDSLTDHQSFCEGPKQAKVREARDQLRESYRTTLGGHPQLRAILAQMCSNIGVFMPPLDLATLLRKVWDLQDQAKRGADTSLLLGDLHQLLCLALEVYREYQRAMWDGSFHQGLHSLLLGQGWLHVPVPKLNEEDFEAPSLEYLVDAGQISDSVEEWHIHRYGFITILVLDTKGNAMTAALMGTQSKSVLSEKQWDAVEEVLGDDGSSVLLLVCDLPLALEESGVVQQEAAPIGADDAPATEELLRKGRWTMSWDMAAGIWDQPAEEGLAAAGSHGSWASSDKGGAGPKEGQDALDVQLAEEVAQLAAAEVVEDVAAAAVGSGEDPADRAEDLVAPSGQGPTEQVAEQAAPVQEELHEGPDFVAGLEEPTGVSGRFSPLTWRESRVEQERLLDKLFEWKDNEPGREVVLVNGAQFSTTGVLHDTRRDISMPVVLAGVVEGHPGPLYQWNFQGALPSGNFTYSYEEPEADHWGLPIVDIDLRENQLLVKFDAMVKGRRRQQTFHAYRSTRGYFTE